MLDLTGVLFSIDLRVRKSEKWGEGGKNEKRIRNVDRWKCCVDLKRINDTEIWFIDRWWMLIFVSLDRELFPTWLRVWVYMCRSVMESVCPAIWHFIRWKEMLKDSEEVGQWCATHFRRSNATVSWLAWQRYGVSRRTSSASGAGVCFSAVDSSRPARPRLPSSPRRAALHRQGEDPYCYRIQWLHPEQDSASSAVWVSTGHSAMKSTPVGNCCLDWGSKVVGLEIETFPVHWVPVR